MVNIPGSHYGEPQFSWKFALPTAAIGFLENRSLGRKYAGDLFVGAATPATSGGHLFRFDLTKNRQRLAWSDPALADQVADNDAKHSIVESESLLFGTGFGVSTDIQTGPGGGLFVVSTTAGAVYEVQRTTAGRLEAALTGNRTAAETRDDESRPDHVHRQVASASARAP